MVTPMMPSQRGVGQRMAQALLQLGLRILALPAFCRCQTWKCSLGHDARPCTVKRSVSRLAAQRSSLCHMVFFMVSRFSDCT